MKELQKVGHHREVDPLEFGWIYLLNKVSIHL